MLLLEHDGKRLLEHFGVPVPAGIMVRTDANVPSTDLPDGPLVVKAQVATGKRGKSGGVLMALGQTEVVAALARLRGLRIAGQPVEWARVEAAVPFTREHYVSLSLDPAGGRVRLLFSAAGGIDVETAGRGELLSADMSLDEADIGKAADAVTRQLPPTTADVLRDATTGLARAFLESDATLIEINPLFVLGDGSWVAGDAKVIIDENALQRRPFIEKLVRSADGRYRDLTTKLDAGFDYMVIDAQGSIGLLTTGAGLTMMLIDELRARGHAPHNFCDIRTGQIHDDPSRLVEVLTWLRAAPAVDTILINVFAGITDLENFSLRFVEAARQVDLGGTRVLARLIGRNGDKAAEVLNAWSPRLQVFTDLDAAISALAEAR